MIHTIHIKGDARPLAGDDTGDSRFDGLVAIPDGVAKWALFFPPVWLAFHALWLPLLAWAILCVATLAGMTTQYWPVPLLLGGLPGLYLFLEGNQLRRNRLEWQGYETIGIVDARNPEFALQRFLAEGNLPQPKTKPPVRSDFARPGFSAQPSIGLFSREDT